MLWKRKCTSIQREAIAGTRPPSAAQAHDQLISALKEQQDWETRKKDGKALLDRLWKSQRESDKLQSTYKDILSVLIRSY